MKMYIRSDLRWSVTNRIFGIAVTQKNFPPINSFSFHVTMTLKNAKNGFKSKINCRWNDMKPFKVGAN